MMTHKMKTETLRRFKLVAIATATILLTTNCGKPQSNSGFNQADDDYYFEQSNSQGYTTQSVQYAQQIANQNQGSGTPPQGNNDEGIAQLQTAYSNYISLSPTRSVRGIQDGEYLPQVPDTGTVYGGRFRWGSYRPRTGGAYIGYHNPDTGNYGVAGLVFTPWGVGLGGVGTGAAAGCWYSFFSRRTQCKSVGNP